MQIKLYIYRKENARYEMWPFSVWFYKYGIGFHWRTIADGHLYLQQCGQRSFRWNS